MLMPACIFQLNGSNTGKRKKKKEKKGEKKIGFDQAMELQQVTDEAKRHKALV